MPRRDARPDEGLVHAWLDGELSAEEASRVERLVAEDAEWAAAAAEARGLVAASTRILGALDVVAGDVIPRGGSAAGVSAPMLVGSRVPSPWFTTRRMPTWLRVAAGVVLVAGVGYLGVDRSTPRSAANGMRAYPRDDGRVAANPPASPAADPVADPAASRVASPVGSGAADAVAGEVTPRDASIAELPIAPPAAASALVRQDSAATITRGVAGGTASGVVTRPSAESKEMLGATAGVPEREARAKSVQRAVSATPSIQSERVLDSPNSISALMADRSVESVRARMSVTGCWRAATTARVDSIQTSLRIVRTEGDTLVMALTPLGAEARLVRESDDLLRGRARDAVGGFVAFVATRTRCAP